jgi:hypothetical protein
MKFLIENYANPFDTQSLYLHKGFLSLGYESVLWDGNTCSIYDIMDKEKPDYYITSAHRLSKDFAHYSKNNDKAKLILNVDHVSQAIIDSIEQSIVDSGMNCGFLFSSTYDVVTKKLRFVHTNNAHDSNLSKNVNTVDYAIDKAIFIDSKEEIQQYDGTYHVLSNNDKIKEDADIVLPEHMMFSLYKNYKEIIFRNITESFIPQSFFDAIAFGNKVYCENIDQQTEERLAKLFKLNNESFDYNSPNKIQNFETVKSTIQEKHLPLNRAKTLISQLPKGDKNERRYSFA